MIEHEYRIRPNGDKIAVLSAADFDALIAIHEAAREFVLDLDADGGGDLDKLRAALDGLKGG